MAPWTELSVGLPVHRGPEAKGYKWASNLARPREIQRLSWLRLGLVTSGKQQAATRWNFARRRVVDGSPELRRATLQCAIVKGRKGEMERRLRRAPQWVARGAEEAGDRTVTARRRHRCSAGSLILFRLRFVASSGPAEAAGARGARRGVTRGH